MKIWTAGSKGEAGQNDLILKLGHFKFIVERQVSDVLGVSVKEEEDSVEEEEDSVEEDEEDSL